LELSSTADYVIDGSVVNKLLEPYNLEAVQPTAQLHHLLPGQVFELVEKKFVKGLLDEIDKAKPQRVQFVNLEALATGPHRDYAHAICGGLAVLMDNLAAKNIQVTGTVKEPFLLPWNLVSRLNKEFKGLAAPGQTIPP